MLPTADLIRTTRRTIRLGVLLGLAGLMANALLGPASALAAMPRATAATPAGEAFPAIIRVQGRNMGGGGMTSGPRGGYDGPRHGGGGGNVARGLGAAIAVPAIIGVLQNSATPEATAPPKKSRQPKTETAAIQCGGGRVKSGKCVCPGSQVMRTVGKNVYSCQPGRDVVIKSPQDNCTDAKGRSAAACRPPEAIVPVVATPQPLPLPLVPPGGAIPLQPEQSPQLPAQPPAVQAAAAPEFVNDEVLVTVATATPEATDDAIGQAYGLQLLERVPIALIDTRILRYRITDGRTPDTVLAALQADPRVGTTQLNFIYRTSAGPGDQDMGSLQYALTKVALTSAHLLSHGRGALVAVIDSGIDTNHPDLASAVMDFFNATGDSDATPDTHGTAVAGIIRANGTVQGIAPQSRLLSVRAFRASGQGRAPAATSVILLRSLDWSIAQGSRLLNLSFAGPQDPLMERAITAASGKRAIMVAAAGNGGPLAAPAYPAAYAEVIAVTATDQSDRLYKDANQGDYIAIAAPGVEILAPSVGAAHQFQSGTSFAAAHVTGIIALMLERNPQLSPETARLALMAGASDLGAPGRDKEFGAGRANAYDTLRLLDQAGGTP